MHDLVFRNGLLITANGLIHADVAVQGEAISAIGQELAGRRTIDATGCYLLPGAIDQHVHMQMPLAGRQQRQLRHRHTSSSLWRHDHDHRFRRARDRAETARCPGCAPPRPTDRWSSTTGCT